MYIIICISCFSILCSPTFCLLFCHTSKAFAWRNPLLRRVTVFQNETQKYGKSFEWEPIGDCGKDSKGDLGPPLSDGKRSTPPLHARFGLSLAHQYCRRAAGGLDPMPKCFGLVKDLYRASYLTPLLEINGMAWIACTRYTHSLETSHQV